MCLSRSSNEYYGQWTLLNFPFRSMDELKPKGLEKVPAHLYHQAIVYLLRPGHWTSAANIRAELDLEAFREHHIRNITAMLFANQGLIQRYLDGDCRR